MVTIEFKSTGTPIARGLAISSELKRLGLISGIDYFWHIGAHDNIVFNIKSCSASNNTFYLLALANHFPINTADGSDKVCVYDMDSAAGHSIGTNPSSNHCVSKKTQTQAKTKKQ